MFKTSSEEFSFSFSYYYNFYNLKNIKKEKKSAYYIMTIILKRPHDKLFYLLNSVLEDRENFDFNFSDFEYKVKYK